MMRPRTGAQKVPPHAQFAPSSSPVATARALLLTSSHFSVLLAVMGAATAGWSARQPVPKRGSAASSMAKGQMRATVEETPRAPHAHEPGMEASRVPGAEPVGLFGRRLDR